MEFIFAKHHLETSTNTTFDKRNTVIRKQNHLDSLLILCHRSRNLLYSFSVTFMVSVVNRSGRCFKNRIKRFFKIFNRDRNFVFSFLCDVFNFAGSFFIPFIQFCGFPRPPFDVLFSTRVIFEIRCKFVFESSISISYKINVSFNASMYQSF